MDGDNINLIRKAEVVCGSKAK